ncbi:Fe(3+) dicitrate transport protein FecA [Methylophilaceae bacterium]|nr:Fe(3+) dicitrate transport protein FecA [Methylophilaceae bacterium]
MKVRGINQPVNRRVIKLCLMAALASISVVQQSQAADAISSANSFNIPPGPLGPALSSFAGKAGVSLSFDPNLTKNKSSAGLSGTYSREEGFKMLLKGSGLTVVSDGQGGFTLERLPVDGNSQNLPLDIELAEIQVRAKRFYEVGPLPGLGLTKEQIPGNVQSITAEEIKQSHSLSITDLMNSKLQSVNVNDYQGNPFQMDVQYRGFTAGPQIGTPQGLSVFFDGIRVNEPFGDVVNWDMIPLNALSGFDVFPGSNPIFGLGTLGGAVSMKTKSGFDSPGVEAEILTGSFGRRQLQASGGWNNGTVGLFGAGNFFLEDGWRENSPSKVNQVFGKASYQGEKLDLNLSSLVVWNDLIGNGLLPSEMYKQDRNGVFTSPDSTDNRLWQFQLAGSYFVNDNFTVTGQVYRRNSKRHAVGADVYTEYGSQFVRRNLNPGEVRTCLFNSTNDYGIPDYYVLDVQDGNAFGDMNWLMFAFSGMSFADAAAAFLPPDSFNAPLPDYFVALAQDDFERNKNFYATNFFAAGGVSGPPVPYGDVTTYSNLETSYIYQSTVNLSQIKDPTGSAILGMTGFYWYTPDTAEAGDLTPGDGMGVKHIVLIAPPTNADSCIGDVGADDLRVPGPQGGFLTVDGGVYNNGTGTGVVEGTPTAVITDSQIDQITDGASVQFNWNYPKHKFMVGASIDKPSAKYKSGQMLGMLDANRDAYLAPDEIRDQYAAASTEISNNNFEGDQITKSIYASETWSPIETLHITGAMRYNETRGKNKIASRTYGSFVWDLSQLLAYPDYFNVCPNGDCTGVPMGYRVPDAANILNKPEKEKFSYYSLNPSLGATWQATPDLNIYGNWAQGTRVPSVIELGCAFDDTPILVGAGTANERYVPKSLRENRFCSLPTTLSGDPYLAQIKATTLDLGLRGRWSDNVEWNLGAYRTNLKDDIYVVTYPGNRSFFDTIGKTRRQGVEAGIFAAFGKSSLRLNYALTEATFEDEFDLAGNDNSSAVENLRGNDDYGHTIRVKKGNRMPGVPLHNLNATLSYQVTPKWQVGLTAVAHSFAYVRGNENNKHQAGVVVYDTVEIDGSPTKVARRVTSNPGKVPGYAVFNFQTSYQLAPEWRLGLLVNNIFDKDYFTAGRLGRNPFSPSIYGAIGPSGYNHNSTDWLSTNFLAPGAPRAAWISLSYEFDPRK